MGGRGGSPSPSALGQALKKAAPVADGMSTEERIIRDLIRDAGSAARMGGDTDTVSISSLRRSLDALGWSRDKQDAEFRKLAAKAVFTPQSNQKVLTKQQREDFFYQGGEPKSWITLRR